MRTDHVFLGFTALVATAVVVSVAYVETMKPTVRVSGSTFSTPQEPTILGASGSTDARTDLPIPEETPSPFVAPPSDEQSPLTDEVSSGLSFKTEVVKRYVKELPNSACRFIPLAARAQDLEFFESEAETILTDWQTVRDRLMAKHGDNLITFCADPETLQNDKDRNLKLKQLVTSVWPETASRFK